MEQINWEELHLERELELVNDQYLKLDGVWDFLTDEISARLDDESIKDLDKDDIYQFLKVKRYSLKDELDKLGDVRCNLRKLVRFGKRLKWKEAN